MKDVADLTGRVAVVAGGGKGIGRSVAMLLGRKHARIVLADVDADAGVDTVAAINGLGGEAAFFLADVSLSNQVQSLVEFAVEKYQRIDVLFSSVGVYARAKLTETDEALWDRIMQVNVKSAFLLCREVIPVMSRSGGGSIILSSSSVGWHGSAPNIAAYATSKFAITGLTKSAACDCLGEHIRINCICPGPTDTPMIRSGRTAEELEGFISRLPTRRLASPDEIANAVLFLASDEGSYLTGVALPVDGGQTAFI